MFGDLSLILQNTVPTVILTLNARCLKDARHAMPADKLIIDWSSKNILRPQSLSSILADHIRDLIVNCQIAPVH